MRRRDGRVLYSPSDLVTFAGSPFASWMDRSYLDRPDGLEPDPDDETIQVLASRGSEHETNVADRFRGSGRAVVDVAESADPYAATLRALEAEIDVVHHAVLTDGVFKGIADFLIRDPDSDHYEVHDAKLSRRASPKHILQLCCYADMLEAETGTTPTTIAVVLGDGTTERFRVSDFRWYARGVRRAFLELMASFDAGGPAPEPQPGNDFGRWSSHAEEWFEERDHLWLVAGISRGQILRMNEAGISTLTDLAETGLEYVKGIGRDVFARLAEQARMQVCSRSSDSPAYRIVAPAEETPRTGLALLPPPSPEDIYLDLEGFPLADDGLEYLFGFVDADTFHDFWAHDEEQEKRAFETVVDEVMTRWRRDRSMHVYHYAAYEVAAFRRLAGKYGTREDEIDALLRADVFVDLYTVVRQGMVLGQPSYSLKYVEHLYRRKREGDVVSAAASIVEYERWLRSGESQSVEHSPILAAIRDYNQDDCESTRDLALWLRARQVEHGIAHVRPGSAEEEPERALSEQNQRRLDLARDMLAEAETIHDPEERRIHELFAHLVEFHRREDKPKWWSLFDRAERTHEELVDDTECLGDVRLAGDAIPDKRSFRVPYTFAAEQESRLDQDATVYLLPSLEAQATVFELDADAGQVVLRIGPKAWGQLQGAPPARASLLPFSIVRATAIQEALFDVATTWRERRESRPSLEHLLGRMRPRLKGHTDGSPLIRPNEDVVAAAERIVLEMEQTTLVIQGPPGAGKTHTAAKAILALLAAGKTVGITSNSHRAIENLMAKCGELADQPVPMTKVGPREGTPLVQSCPGVVHVKSSGDAAGAFTHGVVGGTAWLFSRPEWEDRLDHLFVDEAGQVSMANLIAVSRCARNLVLMGDQMQLGQPLQGTHPGESGQSALEYFMRGRATVEDDRGLFLPRTWRLHAELCDFISDAIYEGRLGHAPHTVNRIVRVPSGHPGGVPVEAGLLFVPVEHKGNSQASEEEVATIVGLVHDLVGRERTDENGADAGPIELGDILFVAPYNAQVRRLRATLGPTARVGSVDKFQGQEAAVVIVSMCASPGEFGPRGAAFVLDLNRLNVAISRAQSLAIVVGDPRLGNGVTASIETMKRMNLYARLVQASRTLPETRSR